MAEEILKNESQKHKGLAEISSGKETSLNRLKRNFYESIHQVFPLDLPYEKDLKNQKTRLVSLNLFKTVQVLSMLEVNKDLHLWSSYRFLWQFFLFFRLDYLSDQISVYEHVLFVTEGLLLASTFLFVYIVSRNYRNNPPHKVAIALVRYSFTLMAEVLYMPAQVFLIKANFYWIIGSEYSHVTLNLPGTVLALTCLYGIKLIYIIGKTDVKHKDKKINISSKAHSDIEVYELKARIASIFFYILRGEQLPNYFTLLLGLSELYIAFMFIKELPYYNSFANKARSVFHLTVGFFSCAMLLGRSLDNAGVAFAISMIGVPVIIIAVLMSCSFDVQVNQSVISDLNKLPDHISSIYQLERNLRPFLSEDTDKDKALVLDAFSVYFSVSAFNREGMLAIWQSNYCMHSLKDFKLARIRLSMYLLSSTGLESDYQYFVCNKALEKDNYHDDVEFLKFKINLEKTIKLDKKFCLQYQATLKELSESKPQVQKIEELLVRIDRNLKVLKKSYKHMMSIHPENSEVFELYSSFLSSILTDSDRSVFIEQMHDCAVKENKRGELEYFNEENGFIIISGEPSSLGTISYINFKAAEILKDTVTGITGNPLNNYLPKTVAAFHNSHLKKFLMNCKSNKINLPESLFFCTGVGYLIEVYIKFRCIVEQHYPFFLILLRERSSNREIMILDDNNRIIAHSEGLPKAIKFEVKNMTGYCTDYFFPQINRITPHELIEVLNEVYIEYRPKKIRNTILHVYAVYKECRWSGYDNNSFNTMRLRNTVKNIRFKSILSEDEKYKGKSSDNNSSAIEINKDEKRIEKIIQNSKKTLKILRYSLILLVGFMGITLTSCSLYVAYGYDSQNIYNIMNDLNKSKSSMLTIAELARIQRLSQDFPKYIELAENIDFLSEVKNLEKFRSIADEAFDRYPNCKSLKDVYHSDTHYWYQGEIKKDNIMNIINAFVSFSYSYFEGDKTQEVYEFIIKNGLGKPYEYIEEVDHTIHHCDEDASNFFNLMILGFFMTDSVIIGVFVVTNTIFLIKFRNLCQSHWERMIDTLSKVYPAIQRTLKKRLECVHEIESSTNRHKRSKGKLSVPEISIAKSMIKYAYILILFIVYLSCVYLVFEKNMKESIIDRRNFCFAVKHTGKEIQELSWWTRESLYENTEYSLCNSLEGDSAFKPSLVYLSEIQTRIREEFKKFQLKKEMEITDQEIYKLFKEFKVNGKVYYSGMNGLVSSLVMESRHYTSLKSDSNVFYELIRNLLNSQQEFFRETFDTTNEIVSRHKIYMVLFNSTFTLCNFITITLFLLRYIQAQKYHLKHRSNFYKLASKEIAAAQAI